MEEWKDIPGYEGLYQASTGGEIRTVEGKITSNRRYGVRRWKGRVMKGRGDRYATGRRVGLWKDGRKSDFLVARLVAMTFYGVPPEGYTVNHKDGNRMNNNVENLEWVTLGDNIRHAFAIGLHTCARGVELCGDAEVHKFRSMGDADRFLGRCVGYVSGCVKKGRAATSAGGAKYAIKLAPTPHKGGAA